ncbi:MAG: FtsQ-type POTRA domain-containing protein [Ruminococcaceae bacterium]|nr:FtsQ-type POTRA domain-containing protein [Oscillospiraceae bacterium]
MATDNTRAREREAAVKKAQKGKRRRRRKQTVAVTLLILTICAAVLCTLSLTVFFKIENIKVSGSNIYTAKEIIDCTEIKAGDNLILALLSKNKVAQKLEKELPFIVKVNFDHALPSTIEIKVTETTEQIYISKKDEHFSADLSGKIIKEKTENDSELVVFSVLPETTAVVGEKATFSTDREQELFKLYADLIRSDEIKVDAVNITDPYGSYMKIEERIIVKFGSSSYFEEKTAYLKAGLSRISKDAEGVFDLSGWSPENNQPVFTYEGISDFEF